MDERPRSRPRQKARPSSRQRATPGTGEPALRRRHSMPRTPTTPARPSAGGERQSSTLRRTKSSSRARTPSSAQDPSPDRRVSFRGSAPRGSVLEQRPRSPEAEVGRTVSGGGSRLPSIHALMADVTRLRAELLAAKRGAHLTEKVEAAMANVRSCWQDAESRLALLEGEQQAALVAHRTLLADVRALELAGGAMRSDLAQRAEDAAATRDRADLAEARASTASEAALASERKCAELTLQLAAAVSLGKVLATELQTADAERAAMDAAHTAAFAGLRSEGERRHALHEGQLATWERELARFLTAGHDARLELVLHEGNVRVFDEFRALLAEQRATSEREIAALREWHVAADNSAERAARRPLAEAHRQLERLVQIKGKALEGAAAAAREEFGPRLEAAERAYRQVEGRLEDARLRLAERDARAARQASEHKRLLEVARGELEVEATKLREARLVMVDAETAAVSRLQRHEAYRARTARRLLLQLHRPMLAKCFVGWRDEAGRAAGRAFSRAGVAGLAALRSGARGRGAAIDDEGDGGDGRGAVSGYMAATLAAMEAEWTAREAEGRAAHAAIVAERDALQVRLGERGEEGARARTALSEQCQSLAAEVDAMAAQRDAARAEAAAAREEAEAVRKAAGVADAHGGALSVDLMQAQLAARRAEARLDELEQRVVHDQAARLAEQEQWRAKLREAELVRCAATEAGAAAADELRAANVLAARAERERALVEGALEQAHAGHAAAEAAVEAAEARLADERAARAAEGAANARWVRELQGALKRAQQQQLGHRAIELHAEVAGLRDELDDAMRRRDAVRAAALRHGLSLWRLPRLRHIFEAWRVMARTARRPSFASVISAIEPTAAPAAATAAAPPPGPERKRSLTRALTGTLSALIGSDEGGPVDAARRKGSLTRALSPEVTSTSPEPRRRSLSRAITAATGLSRALSDPVESSPPEPRRRSLSRAITANIASLVGGAAELGVEPTAASSKKLPQEASSADPGGAARVDSAACVDDSLASTQQQGAKS